MFRVMSPFIINVPTSSLHETVFSNYGWHISITIAMFVNTKHRYKCLPSEGIEAPSNIL